MMRGEKRADKILGYLAKLLLIFLVYLVAGKISLSLALFHPSASAVWMGTGISIASLFLFGYRFWPAIFVGAFFLNLTTEGTVATSLGIAAGNMIEGLLGAYLIRRFAGSNKVLDNPGNIFKFFAVSLKVAIISATIGVTSLALGGFATWATYSQIWATWWIGNVAGALIVFPLIVSWYQLRRTGFYRISEGILIMLSVAAVAILVFTQWSPFASQNYPIQFICLLPLVWAALRLGHRGTTLAIFIMSSIAIFGTVSGFGPFAAFSPNEALLFLQLYVGIIALVGLTISSLSAKRLGIKNKKQG